MVREHSWDDGVPQLRDCSQVQVQVQVQAIPYSLPDQLQILAEFQAVAELRCLKCLSEQRLL